MGVACGALCQESAEVVKSDSLPSSALPSAWSLSDLDLFGEPGLQEPPEGSEGQLQGRLLQEAESHAKFLGGEGLPAGAVDYPKAAAEKEVAALLVKLRSGSARLQEPFSSKVLPLVSRGLHGSSPLHVASMPCGDVKAWMDVLFFCLEEQVGFGAVWEANWDSTWLTLWTLRQREASAAGRQLLLLTEEDGSLGPRQQLEVAWLLQQGLEFKHLRLWRFLLQVRPLLQAAKQGEEERVEKLLVSDSVSQLFMQRGPTGSSAMHVLAMSGSSRLLALALLSGGRPDAVNFEGAAPLLLASQEGREEAVRQLLLARAEVDQAMANGCTALFQASANGHGSVVRRLLEARAGLERAKSPGGTRPLFVAGQQGHVAVLRLLLEARAAVDGCAASGATALFQANQAGQEEAVQELLNARANVDSTREDGCTPLWMAAEVGHVAAVKQLLAARAEVDRARTNGSTPLNRASQRGHDGVVRLLLQAEADPTLAREDGLTALEAARRWGGEAVLQVYREGTRFSF